MPPNFIIDRVVNEEKREIINLEGDNRELME